MITQETNIYSLNKKILINHHTMKLKQIYELLLELQKLLQQKFNSQITKTTLPTETISHTEGQLFEINYILNKVENIIFSDPHS